MATKVNPKVAAKANPKAAADKEKLAAEHSKMIEKLVPAAAKPISALMEAEKNKSQCEMDVLTTFRELAEDNDLSREDVGNLYVSAYADAYEISLETAKKELQFKKSRVVNFAVPKSPATAKQIEAAVEKGVGIVALHKIAASPDGSVKAAQAAKSLGRGGATGKKSEQKNKEKVIDDVDKASAIFCVNATQCSNGGLSIEDTLSCMLNAYVNLKSIEGELDIDEMQEEVKEALEACIAGAQANQTTED